MLCGWITQHILVKMQVDLIRRDARRFPRCPVRGVDVALRTIEALRQKRNEFSREYIVCGIGAIFFTLWAWLYFPIH